MDNKEDFKDWVLNNLSENSGAGPAYITSLEWLSNKFLENGKTEKSIFEIDDTNLIEKLYLETKKIQKDPKSFIYNSTAPSYGSKHFYSASLKKYKEFLMQKDNSLVNRNSEMIDFNFRDFIVQLKSAGLIFSEKIVARFIASLCTKPFLICSGLSGSGKTKLAQSFVKWICAGEEQYKIVPVGADWTNREPLLGYPNALDGEKYVRPDNGVLDLIIHASENENLPHFLILDEMNLSHVERYFADFLSSMESGDHLHLHSGKNPIDGVEGEILLPKNLFIIGTVNIDETTYMFSPKVLDRANVIEFRIGEQDIKAYLDSGNVKPDMDKFLVEGTKEGLGASMSADFLTLALGETVKVESITDILVLFFKELQKAGAEFGYRSASEINRLIGLLDKLAKADLVDGEKLELGHMVDIAIMQKLLPKLHGSRTKLSKILPVLGSFCLSEKARPKVKETYLNKLDEINFETDSDILYKLSFEKICRMYKNAIENGYASYAEA